MQDAKELIIQTLIEKSSLKQDIYRLNLDVFEKFKVILRNVAVKLQSEIHEHDKRILVEYSENSPFSIVNSNFGLVRV